MNVDLKFRTNHRYSDDSTFKFYDSAIIYVLEHIEVVFPQKSFRRAFSVGDNKTFSPELRLYEKFPVLKLRPPKPTEIDSYFLNLEMGLDQN